MENQSREIQVAKYVIPIYLYIEVIVIVNVKMVRMIMAFANALKKNVFIAQKIV